MKRFLRSFHAPGSPYVRPGKRRFWGMNRSFLRVPIAWRLAAGFFLAASLAAIVTWVIGSQHTAPLRQQADFYQVLLQTNITLTNGIDLLKSIDDQKTKLLTDAAPAYPDVDLLTSDEQGLRSLMTRYNEMLLTYVSQNLLSRHPDELALLGGTNLQTIITQQIAYIAGALHTWQIYMTVQNSLLQDVQLGEIAQANSLARLQGEPTFADALSALHSLIQFNEQLSTSINQGVSNETEQQLLFALLGSLIAFLGVLLSGIFLSRTLVQRLRKLHQVTSAVEQGQTGVRVPVVGRDEIADVSRSVNTMLDSLVEAIEQTTAAKEQLDRAYQHQRRLNDMKDRFIQNVSHELRTPLTGIYGFLQLLHEHQDQLEPAQQAMFLEQALSGCEDLLSLFATILDAADLNTVVKAPHLEVLPLSPIITHLVEQSDPVEREKHPVSLDVPVSLAVWADAHYLRQVLRNLLSNAFKYTPAQTLISISAGESKPGSGPASAWVCVKDAGPGIPPEEQSMLFQQFVRLKRDLSGTIRGTGLGLYLCRQFVEAMDGSIRVESSGIAGEGSTFSFTLPLAPTTPGTASSKPSERPFALL